MFIRTHTQVEFSLPYHFLSNFFSLCRQQKVGSTKHKTKKKQKKKKSLHYGANPNRNEKGAAEK
jgi:hypothetical protein